MSIQLPFNEDGAKELITCKLLRKDKSQKNNMKKTKLYSKQKPKGTVEREFELPLT
jgi:hypothetical protein